MKNASAIERCIDFSDGAITPDCLCLPKAVVDQARAELAELQASAASIDDSAVEHGKKVGLQRAEEWLQEHKAEFEKQIRFEMSRPMPCGHALWAGERTVEYAEGIPCGYTDVCQICTELAELQEEIADNKVAMDGANEIIGKYEADQTEIGPCGKHPRSFWKEVKQPGPVSYGHVGECSLCREIEQAVEGIISGRDYLLKQANENIAVLERGRVKQKEDKARNGQVPEETVSSAKHQAWLRERQKQDPLNPMPIEIERPNRIREAAYILADQFVQKGWLKPEPCQFSVPDMICDAMYPIVQEIVERERDKYGKEIIHFQGFRYRRLLPATVHPGETVEEGPEVFSQAEIEVAGAYEAAAQQINQCRDLIGRVMHISWSRTKIMQGFHPLDPSAPCQKCHADLVDWSELPQAQKDINLNAFRDVIPVLEHAIRSLDSSAAQRSKKRIREEALREAAKVVAYTIDENNILALIDKPGGR